MVPYNVSEEGVTILVNERLVNEPVGDYLDYIYEWEAWYQGQPISEKRLFEMAGMNQTAILIDDKGADYAPAIIGLVAGAGIYYSLRKGIEKNADAWVFKTFPNAIINALTVAIISTGIYTTGSSITDTRNTLPVSKAIEAACAFNNDDYTD